MRLGQAAGVINWSRSALNFCSAFRRSGVASTNSDFAWKTCFPSLLHQHAEHFAHAPARRSDQLQANGRGAQQCDTTIAKDANGIGIPIEDMQLKAREVDPLQLFSRIGHGKARDGLPAVLALSLSSQPSGRTDPMSSIGCTLAKSQDMLNS